ncbi:MAG: metallopeptidase family protein [Alphaproteobacteria bacterium]|nr:MAG: metallopeptidase family protein [Alphaproteobacteria bacterium]
MNDPSTAITRFGAPPSVEDIVELAEHALTAIPAKLRREVRGVAILVEEAPDDELLTELGIENAWDLTGLYRGVPIGEKGAGGTRQEPDMILLFREPILLEWIETGGELFNLVRTVLIHEIAHHFGFSDADIEDLERE